jgi:hypothetical protein
MTNARIHLEPDRHCLPPHSLRVLCGQTLIPQKYPKNIGRHLTVRTNVCITEKSSIADREGRERGLPTKRPSRPRIHSMPESGWALVDCFFRFQTSAFHFQTALRGVACKKPGARAGVCQASDKLVATPMPAESRRGSVIVDL